MTRFRAAVSLVVVMLLCVPIAGLSGTAHADPPPTPTITLTGPASVNVGTPGVMQAQVSSPSTPGETVTLERFGGIFWDVIGTATLDAASKATFSQTPAQAGSTQYRVSIAASAAHAAAVSAPYTMVAVMPVPTVTLAGPAQVGVNTPGVMTVSVTNPPAGGEIVTLERFGGVFWNAIGTATLDASSQATFTQTPTAVGSTRYRASIASTATHSAATSAEYVMQAVVIPPVPAKNCGATVLKSDGVTPWECTYSDDFDGTALDRRFWVPQDTANSNYLTGDPSQFTCYADRPDVISVHDGSLHLSLVDLGTGRYCGGLLLSSRYVAGMVSHYQTFSQTYGRYEVRAKLPSVLERGIQETFWLWPVNDTKYGGSGASGEIDFAEFYSRYPDKVKPYIHYTSNEDAEDPDHTRMCPINYGQFNTYGLEWYPGLLKISVNGVPCMESTYPATNVASPAPFDQPFFLALTQAMGVSNAYDPSDNHYDTNVIPDVVTTQVDWVRIWK